jgi:cytochrome c peroxidase
LISGRSAFDRYVYDDDLSALSESAKRGMALFYSRRSGCADCHFGFDFSGELNFVGHVASITARSVPSLRNVALTSPYMHDGRFATLGEVIDDYDRGGTLSGRADLKRRHLGLRQQDKADLLAFLNSLSDPQFISNPQFRAPPAP